MIGIAGSGKTTLARRLGEALGAPVYDLDRVVYDRVTGERPAEEILRRMDEIGAGQRWVTEGGYRDAWLAALLADADVIVWLDVPFATCATRMIKRHLRAEMAGSNQHPGWGKLMRFLKYTRTTAARQRRETAELLRPYASKVERCRSSREVDALWRSLCAT